jgi:hypothetical protein
MKIPEYTRYERKKQIRRTQTNPHSFILQNLLSAVRLCNHGSELRGSDEDNADATRVRRDASFFLQSEGILRRSTNQSENQRPHFPPSHSSCSHENFYQPTLWIFFYLVVHFHILKEQCKTHKENKTREGWGNL